MSRTERTYVDVHILQTVPPSCVNRDDTGSPKTAVYGGAVRARVSSQAWKHAVRGMFVDIFSPEQRGERTKRIVEKIAEKIGELKPDIAANEAEKLAKETIEKTKKTNKKENKSGKNKSTSETSDEAAQSDVLSSALFFMSDAQATALAELALNGESDKEKYRQALRGNPSVDIALFGRMVADDPSMNYDAAVQVAHAISTHAVRNEYDYFTAVDDRAPEDNAGAAHLGTVEFNSSTLYRYATVNVNELVKHLDDETPDALRGFLEAFIYSMPTGKQNTFANRTLPDAVYVAIRSDQPVNLSGAFEAPIKARRDGGFAEASAQQLAKYAGDIYGTFVSAPDKAFITSRFDTLNDIAERTTISDMLDAVKNYAAEHLSKTGAK